MSRCKKVRAIGLFAATFRFIDCHKMCGQPPESWVREVTSHDRWCFCIYECARLPVLRGLVGLQQRPGRRRGKEKRALADKHCPNLMVDKVALALSQERGGCKLPSPTPPAHKAGSPRLELVLCSLPHSLWRCLWQCR
jgi:hypothetical protein